MPNVSVVHRISMTASAACVAILLGCTVDRKPPTGGEVQPSATVSSQATLPGMVRETATHAIGPRSTVAPTIESSEVPSINLSKLAEWSLRQVRGVAWSPASDAFAITATDKDGPGLLVFSPTSTEPTRRVNEIFSFGVAFDTTGNTIASSLTPFVTGVRTWDRDTGEVLGTLKAQECTSGEYIQYHPDRPWIITATSIASKGDAPDVSYVYIWDIRGNQCVNRVVLPGYRLSSMAVTDDGKALILSLVKPPVDPADKAAHRVEIREIDTNRELCVMEDQTYPLKNKENELMTLDANTWSTLRTWDLSICASTSAITVGSTYALAVVPDGDYIITGSDTIRVWSVQGPKVVFESSQRTGDYVEALYLSPNGRYLVSVVGHALQADMHNVEVWVLNTP